MSNQLRKCYDIILKSALLKRDLSGAIGTSTGTGLEKAALVNGLRQFSPSASMSYDNKNKVHNKIHDLITKSKKPVFVFMKGIPTEPSCNYSSVVVQILDAYGVNYDSCDVLQDEDIRREIKSYSDWPTIPQVYKDGSFIGGCDILLQMHQSGELKQMFGGSTESAKEGEKPS